MARMLSCQFLTYAVIQISPRLIEYLNTCEGTPSIWFPINKQFGPVNVSEVGVRYAEDTTGKYRKPAPLCRFSWMRMQKSLDSMLPVMILE